MKFIMTAVVASLFFTGLTYVHAEEAPAVDAPAVESPQAEPGKVSVTLLSNGAEPRRKLRYEFDADAKDRLDVTMKMGMTISMAGQAMPKQDMPAMVQSIDIEPIAVENGSMNYRFTLTKMDVVEEGANPMIVASMKQAGKDVVGLTGTGTVDNRGFSTNKVEMPEDANAMKIRQINGFNDTMSRVSSPLPEEAIGVGAQWKVGMPVAMNGVAMKGDYTYTLVSFDGDSVKTIVVTEMSAKDQSIDDPSLPPGAKVNINKILGKGNGEVELRLNSMCPVSDISAKIVQDATISMEGQPGQNMAMEIDMNMNIQPGTPGDDKAEADVAEEKEAEPVAN